MVEIFSKINSEVDTAVLAASTPISIGNVMAAPVVRNFMLKNLKTIVHGVFPDKTDACCLVLADGDASASEILEAMASTSIDLEDRVEYPKGQQEVRRVWDIQDLDYTGLVNGGAIMQTVQWKLPPKGVPILKGGGLQIMAFNMDSANGFTNGPSFMVVHKIMGGWF